MFISEGILASCSWQHFERVVLRLLFHEGYSGIRLVGQTADRGADIIAHRFGKRWLFQVKHWKNRVNLPVLDQTVAASRAYRADIPVIVALNGFDAGCYDHQQSLMSRHIPLQLWDQTILLERASKLSPMPPLSFSSRGYQEEAIQAIVKTVAEGFVRKALIVMATGLGKTSTAAEAIRRLSIERSQRVLVLAHTNVLVYQLERAFWPFLRADQETLVWNGYERPSLDDLKRAPYAFACVNTVADRVEQGFDLPTYDILLVDECHHAGAAMYRKIIDETHAGLEHGPFLLGLTATPWRPDEHSLDILFDPPLVTVDIIMGLKKGFLSQIDYRMHVDNIDWEALHQLKGDRFSPKHINRTLFITEWDDSVVFELKRVWNEQSSPKALVFCGTIDHAITMRDKINALGFANAAAIYSGTNGGKSMDAFERNRILCDLHDGTINVVCAVDIFNEGVDVPDVNIIVFQRVTHSRRIFVQQLGRGLRVAEGKDRVIVLDFVSDIRRFAAGLELKDGLEEQPGTIAQGPIRVRLNNKVTFKRVGGEDKAAESFLREWLNDIAAIESADDEKSVLRFPPPLSGR